MIDARRNRVYTGIYSFKNARTEEILSPDAIDIDELLEDLKKYDEIIVNGNGSSLYREKIEDVLGDKVVFSTIGGNSCRAASVGELALIKYNEGVRDDYFTLVPDYLRKSQAERELNKNA